MANIKIGDRIPSDTLMTMGESGTVSVDTKEFFSGKTVLLFAVPGAFTPTCSAKHLPGYIKNAEALKNKGIDEIACLSVNDPFVMDSWSKANNADGVVTMLADGNASLTSKLGLKMDASAFGMGIRSQRYCMIAKNGVVTLLNVEAPMEFKVSSAEYILGLL